MDSWQNCNASSSMFMECFRDSLKSLWKDCKDGFKLFFFFF